MEETNLLSTPATRDDASIVHTNQQFAHVPYVSIMALLIINFLTENNDWLKYSTISVFLTTIFLYSSFTFMFNGYATNERSYRMVLEEYNTMALIISMIYTIGILALIANFSFIAYSQQQKMIGVFCLPLVALIYIVYKGIRYIKSKAV